MGWVRQRKPPTHKCDVPPVKDATGFRDLWRCDHCGFLWQMGLACDYCDYQGHQSNHPHQHMVGWMWRASTMWQRFLYRNR